MSANKVDYSKFVVLQPSIESQASSGTSGTLPLEVAGYIPVVINGIKFKIPLYYS